MTPYSFTGSLLHRVVTYTLILALTTTSSIPIVQRITVVVDAYHGLVQRLGGALSVVASAAPALDAITAALPADPAASLPLSLVGAGLSARPGLDEPRPLRAVSFRKGGTTFDTWRC